MRKSCQSRRSILCSGGTGVILAVHKKAGVVKSSDYDHDFGRSNVPVSLHPPSRKPLRDLREQWSAECVFRCSIDHLAPSSRSWGGYDIDTNAFPLRLELESEVGVNVELARAPTFFNLSHHVDTPSPSRLPKRRHTQRGEMQVPEENGREGDQTTCFVWRNWRIRRACLITFSLVGPWWGAGKSSRVLAERPSLAGG